MLARQGFEVYRNAFGMIKSRLTWFEQQKYTTYFCYGKEIKSITRQAIVEKGQELLEVENEENPAES
jgi:hypothetical protein